MTKGINTENKNMEALKTVMDEANKYQDQINKDKERNLIHEKGIEDIKLERSKNETHAIVLMVAIMSMTLLGALILHGIFTEHQNIRADCNIINDESFNITQNSNKTYIPKGTLNCKFDAQMSIISYLAMR